MDRDKMKMRMMELKDELRSMCGGNSDFDGKIDELLSLKGQLSVEPMHFYVPENEAGETNDFGAFTVTKLSDRVHYHQNGYDVFVSANLGGLYQHLNALSEARDIADEEEDKSWFDALLSATATLMSVPLYSFLDLDVTVKMSEFVLKCVDELYEKIVEGGAKPEDREAIRLFEEMQDGVKTLIDYVDKGGGDI